MEPIALFHDRLGQVLAAAHSSEHTAAVLVLTIDRYSGIKISHGPQACSALLSHVATALARVLQPGESMTRLLGCQFAVIIPGLAREEDVLGLAERVLEAVKRPMPWHNDNVATSASIGIALAGDGRDSAAVLRAAHVAMAQALSLGGNRFCFYRQEMNARSARIWALDALARRAARHGRDVLAADPPRSTTMQPLWRVITNNV
ncbi:diguanylate cyclase [Pseudoduganella sp. DS3]|uniref:Diguanylate cyclase n=1 Tax=Pseudoduganella guangdongensis TaxID=2692179 RepID=A0A6N9HK17_9BURK|nr:GGDEF domain-containing protein [Pseudoduganella guangdongensis]MYN03679.1 diguanylate cyclase [Pseudoduganella guangdongensis]